MDKPIPAFYGCYLLRSSVRHASLYIGSTPHPARRLGQHNGKGQGGAVRTSRISLRPWEMACIVAGFPSNIAALQFEWAWHNAHLTRHIPQEDRISFATTRTKVSARTGKTSRRPGRPRTSLTDKLSNLHLLLRVPYFSKWPLELRFFDKDVYRVWQTWCDRVDEGIRPGIQVFLDLPSSETVKDAEPTSAQLPIKRRKVDLIGKGGVDGIDPTYARFQDVLEKSRFLLDEDDEHRCGECQEELDLRHDLYTVCPHQNCQELSHVKCLADRFLAGSDSTSLLPNRGTCRSCRTGLSWAELMREVSLRMRGEKELQKLFRRKRRTKVATAAEIMESEEEGDIGDESDEALTAADMNDEDLDDNMSVTSVESNFSHLSRHSTSPKRKNENGRLEIVIEDSDDGR